MVVGRLSKHTPTYLLCYASQKGNAQSIAEDIYEQSTSKVLQCYLSCISEIKCFSTLKKYSNVVFIGSTTGDGDPPDTALEFMRELKKLESCIDSFTWLHYTILGLGDTNYTNFCNFGKTLDKHLQLIGAQRFYDCGWADDGTGLEIVIEPWLEGLFPALKSFMDSVENKIVPEDCLESKSEANVKNIQNHTSNVFTKTCVNGNFDKDTLGLVEIMATKTQSDTVDSSSQSVSLTNLFPRLKILERSETLNHDILKCKFSPEDILNLPIVPSPFLLTEFSSEIIEQKYNTENKLEKMSYPMEASDIITCTVSSSRQLTANSANKKALEITLKLKSEGAKSYEPGDSFGIVVHNTTDEVNLLLCLLNLTDKADFLIKISVDPTTKKRGACIPKFIPPEGTLRNLFTYFLDIRSVPKKPFLRALIEWTVDLTEKRRLMEFVSKEGTDLYNEYVRIGGLTFLDLLIYFRSCQPPVALLLEHLSRLLPRPYSITSFPLVTPDELSFVFNVIEIPMGKSVAFTRKGICTGFLDELTENIQKLSPQSLTAELESLRIQDDRTAEMEVQIYFRTNQNFRLPKDLLTPIVMIGPGTGIAPFIGFLKHREALHKADPTKNLGGSWIFFGCRNKEKDYLYHSELETFCQNDTLTKLSVSFSREEQNIDSPKYVQDNLSLMGAEVVDYIHNKNASVYVCGDAKNMSKDVFETFVSLLQKHLQLSELDSRKYVAQMQLGSRYLQDVWA